MASDATAKASAAPKEKSDAGSNELKITPQLVVGLLVGLGCVPLAVLDEKVIAESFAPSSSATFAATKEAFIFAGACVGLCACIDFGFARWFGKGRYFAFHVVVNAIIISWGFSDALSVVLMANPLESNTCVQSSACSSPKAPMAMTLAATVWHSVAYALKPIDIVHHVPTLVVTSVVLFFPWGGVMNFGLVFAFMGFPGLIDYALLVGVKMGWVASKKEKDYNQSLNVWIRAPFAVISAYFIVVGALTRPADFNSMTHRVVHGIIGVHNWWNGSFFMYRTVEARTRYVVAMEAEKKAAKASGAAALM